MRYIAVERERAAAAALRRRSLADVLLSAFMSRRELLQSSTGSASRSSARATRSRPGRWSSSAPQPPPVRVARRRPSRRRDAARLPCCLPGGAELRNPTPARSRARSASASSSERREEVDLASSAAARRGLGAAVYGASEGLETLLIEGSALGGQAGTSRRIENYLGFPAGISGSELTCRAITQARKFGARTATPYRAALARARRGRHLVRLEDDHEVAAARSCWPPAPSTGGCPSTTSTTTRAPASSTPPARPRRSTAAAAGRRRRRRQLGGAGGHLARPRRRARHAPAPPRGPARDDVRLPDPRSRALRRRRPRPQRGRRAARRRRAPRGCHAARRRAAAVRRSCSASSAPPRAPTGSATPSPATTRASSSPASSRAPRPARDQRRRASTRPATSLRLDQALRHRRRRGRDGRPLRARAPGPPRRRSTLGAPRLETAGQFSPSWRPLLTSDLPRAQRATSRVAVAFQAATTLDAGAEAEAGDRARSPRRRAAGRRVVRSAPGCRPQLPKRRLRKSGSSPSREGSSWRVRARSPTGRPRRRRGRSPASVLDDRAATIERDAVTRPAPGVAVRAARRRR